MNIQISGVTKIFSPNIAALDNVSLRVDKGEFIYLMGKSGSGKSTLMHLVTREVLPTSGIVYVGGYNLLKMKRADIPFYRRDVGVVAQDFALIPRLTAFENVAFTLEAMGVPERYVSARTEKVLEQVGMLRRKSFYPRQLSGGEQQRVAIARALAKAPSLILADEPTGNLDAKTTDDIMDLFWAINASGVTMIMATHNQTVVEKHHGRVVELNAGRIIRDAKTESNDNNDDGGFSE